MPNMMSSGATVANPSPAPDKEQVIVNSAHAGKAIAFERHNIDGTPCIIGNGKEGIGDSVFFTAVFSLSGGRTAIHPLHVRGLFLCEVHDGDFILIMERVGKMLYVDSYCVVSIGDHRIGAVHATL